MNLFANNLRALQQTHPQLAERIQSTAIDPQVYQIRTTPSRYPSLQLSKPNHPSLLWHSRYDPWRETQRDIQSLDHSIIYVPIIAGMGLGYTLRYLWDYHRHEFFDLIVLEADPCIFRLALENTRLEDILSHSRVYFHVGEDLNAWSELIHRLIPAFMSCQSQVLPHKPSQQLHQTFYQHAFRILRNRIDLTTAEFDLMIRSGKQLQENLWKNLPAILDSHGTRELQNLNANQPVIVIAAGPSLDKNIAQLRTVQDRFFIIVVDTAFRTLHKHGIIPDILVTTDPTSLNLKHFENVPPHPSTFLAFDPEVYYKIPSQWPNQKIFINLEKTLFTRWIEENLGPYGYLPKGGSVGHTAFYLACQTRARLILFLGFDLAFNPQGGTTHSRDSALYRNHASIPEGTTTAQLEPRRNAQALQEKIVWVKGIHNQPVPTSHIMSLYIQQFAEAIRQSQTKVVDATEGGAWIPGSEIMTLKEAIQKLTPSQTKTYLSCLPPPRKNIEYAQQLCQQALHSIRHGAQKAQKALEMIPSLESHNTPPHDTSEWKHMEEAFSFLYESPEIKIAMEQALFSAVYQFIQKERPDQWKIRLQKYRTYFEYFVMCYPYFENVIQLVEKDVTP